MKAKSLLSDLGGRCLLSVFFLILTLASVNALAASNPVEGSSTVAPAGFAVVGPFGIFVPGPSPVPPFSGTTVDFEGFAEGTAIVGQYSGVGVTFTQDDFTPPMIDNHPTIFAYGSSSGVGLLTGSEFPALFPTVAGLVANFTRPVGRVGAYMTDTAPLGTYTVTAFNGVGGVIDTVTVFGTDFPGVSGPPCPLFPAPATGCGVFVGFNTGVSNIASIQFGRSSADGDAFAIDDLVFAVMGIGEIKPGTPFTPNPSGNGRGLAYDDFNILYYTITATNEIYRVTTAGVSLGAIPNPGRPALCGGLSWDSSTGHLWCGSYDGTSDVYTVSPVTGIATFQFNTNAVVGGINQDSCYGPGVEVFIDGIALDTDGTLWLSGDAAQTVYHIDPVGPVLLGSFVMPDHPFSGTTGCSTGIAVAPGGYLELAMQAGADLGTHEIVKVEKLDFVDNPPVIVSFTTLFTDNPGTEDIAFDPDTYAPRCVVWTNQFGSSNPITAYDVQCTRTIGYWKNHPAEDFTGESFLPIDLGDSDEDGVCMTAATQDDVDDILNAHRGQDVAPKLKAQLLAAELNLAMGDIPQGDLDAIEPIIDAAHELLGRNDCVPDTGKKGDDRAEAQFLHDTLDAFNNMYAP